MLFLGLLALAGFVKADIPITDIDMGHLGTCAAYNYIKNNGDLSNHGFYVDNRQDASRLFGSGCGVPEGPSYWSLSQDAFVQFLPDDYVYKPNEGMQAPTGATLQGTITLDGGTAAFDLKFDMDNWTGSPGTDPLPKTGGAADPTTWDFFESGSLTLTGQVGTPVEGIVITGVRKGPAIQYGPKRANDKSMVGIGLSTWIQLKGEGNGSVLQGVNAGSACQVSGTNNGIKKTGRTTDININLRCLGRPDIGGFGGDNPQGLDERCTGHPSNEVIV